MLSTASIEKFQALYEREFGVQLSTDEAAEQAQLFLTGARVVLQPMPKSMEGRYKEKLAEQKSYGT
ncbi:MAG: hypothetical protein ACYC48_01520 [Minisyncoccota bacterium]